MHVQCFPVTVAISDVAVAAAAVLQSCRVRNKEVLKQLFVAGGDQLGLNVEVVSRNHHDH